MRLTLLFARRYLLSKKSHSAINIISAISAGGIAIATMALICVLSVFNGFRELIGGLYSTFDPAIEVVPAHGKYADATDARLQALRRVEGVAHVSETLTEQALILYQGNPQVITVKGIDDAFVAVTGIDSIVHDAGMCPMPLPPLTITGIDYGVPGRGLASRMGIDYGQVQICAPRRGKINMVNPAESFNVCELFSTSTYFEVKQKTYDDDCMLTSLDFARRLFEQQGMVSALALSVNPGADVERVKAAVKAAAGPDYVVRDRAEQHADTFRVMQIEKLMAYFFLTFIVVIASFNLIGSVAMLIIDKRDNAATLRSLGMDRRRLARIFLTESRMITLIGAIAGVVLGIGLCMVQQHFGLLTLGGSGAFIVEAYPVSVHVEDVLLVFATVLVVGFATVWWPVHALCRRMF